MRTLTATELLDVWEIGERQHPLDRAMTLLTIACPEKKYSELVHLSIGQRDALLFGVRELIFGPEMSAYTVCPECGVQLEFTVNTEDLFRNNTAAGFDGMSVKLEGHEIRFRLPDSADLAEIVNSGRKETGKELLKRCIVEMVPDNTETMNALTGERISELGEMMATSDPLSEVKIALNCTDCGAGFTEVLDILAFLWQELSGQARGILNQVHLLARYYGWRESDILAMKPWRRQYYLDMITNG